MNAGALRRHIVIEVPTRSSDGMGGWDETWAAVSSLVMFGQIEPASAQEITIMAGQNMVVTHKVTVRFRTDIVPSISMRIRYQNRLFKIKGFTNVEERNREWNFYCEEGHVQYASG